MSNKKKIFIVLGIIILLVVAFVAGMFVEQYRNAKPDLAIDTVRSSQTFYAKIEKINEYNGNITILVKGLDVNDINYRGEFSLSMKNDPLITWRGEELNVSDLDIGDTISIKFNDEALLSIYPTPIRSIQWIQLLDDEK